MAIVIYCRTEQGNFYASTFEIATIGAIARNRIEFFVLRDITIPYKAGHCRLGARESSEYCIVSIFDGSVIPPLLGRHSLVNYLAERNVIPITYDPIVAIHIMFTVFSHYLLVGFLLFYPPSC